MGRYSHLVYAAKCTKHILISVDCTTEELNKWFTGHRLGIRYNNNSSTEEDENFISNSCDFKRKELKAYILRKYSAVVLVLEMDGDKCL